VSHSTTTAKLFVDADGKPLIRSWTDWEGTLELRFWVPVHATTKPPRLQQRFIRRGRDSVGHICGGEFEWRDVPTVVS
jgi:hypothetical protein